MVNEDSNDIALYLEETAWQDAKEIAKDDNSQEVYSFNILYQLRQLRSKFYHLSTYFICRGSATNFNDHITQPYTIWTYCNYDSQTDESIDRIIVSKLFQFIAIQVIKFSNSAAIEEEMIQSLVFQCKGRNVKVCLERIISLFDETKKNENYWKQRLE